MKGERLCLIVNPRSAAGATGRRLGALRRAADRCFDAWDLRTTEGPGHATALAAEAVAQGYDVVVAVGGDGTASEVANGLFDGDRPRSERVVFSVVPAGTGSDLVKTVGMPSDPDEALRVVAEVPARPTDVTSVHLVDAAGDAIHRIGLNVTGFGLNGEVAGRANVGSKRLGGRATFAIATLRALASYRAGRVALRWTEADGREGAWEGHLASAFVANGQFCGGGMWVGRGGRMDDGLVDLTILPDLPLRTSIPSLPRLFDGTIRAVKNVSSAAVRTLEATPLGGARVLVDIDGEQPGLLPARVRVLPKMLLVRGLWTVGPK